jgi:YHS domain-containing protein
MKFNIFNKLVIILIILVPLFTYQGCKKQPKCGCGKDVIFTLDSTQVLVQYDEKSKSAMFYPLASTGATYYFCNPGKWIDSLKKMDTQQYVLLSGKAYYECNYLYNSSNYYYQIPPVYQVDVTLIMEDNYGKK